MSTLYLLRHAQADYDSHSGLDIDRRLSPEGIKQAQLIAQHLAQLSPKPVNILASPAQRTRQTALAIAKTLNIKPEKIHWLREIYEASAGQLLHCLQQRKSLFPLILVGHNPGLEVLARSIQLAEQDANHSTGIRMGTATLIQFNWPENTPVLSCQVPLAGIIHATDLA